MEAKSQIDFCRLAVIVLYYCSTHARMKYANDFGVIRASNRDLQQLLGSYTIIIIYFLGY